MPSASSSAAPTRPTASGERRTGYDKAVLGGKVVAFAACAVLVLAFPSMAPDAFILSVGVVIASYAALAVSWNFVGGFTGYISLGHAAYSGLGAYATALLVIETGLNPWLAMLTGALLVPALAVPIGIASLRVRGASFVIVSIALVLILLLVFQSWGSFTGGSNGLRVPRPFSTDVLRPEQHERFFYLHAVLLAASLLVALGAPLVADVARWIPGLSSGSPKRILGLTAYACAWLAASGLNALWSGNGAGMRRALLGIGMLLASLGAVAWGPYERWLFPALGEGDRAWFREALECDFLSFAIIGTVLVSAAVLSRRLPRSAACLLDGGCVVIFHPFH